MHGGSAATWAASPGFVADPSLSSKWAGNPAFSFLNGFAVCLLLQRADEAEARVSDLEVKAASLQSTLDAERGTVMTTLRECHERDSHTNQRTEQLEAEVLRLAERLK